jgi:hypothetical protein
MDTPRTDVAVGDVIQLDPAAHEAFGGCLLIVEEVRTWGLVAAALIPQGGGPAHAPYRVAWGAFARIGPAAWPLKGD